MKVKLKKGFSWLFAVVLVIGTSTYQKRTGPTYPKSEELKIENSTLKFELLRTHGGTENCKYQIPVGKKITGKLYYRVYPTKSEFTVVELKNINDSLQIELPHQPPAGKLEYFLELIHNNNSYFVNKEQPIIIRFKGDVPNSILIPHIIFMFFGLLFVVISALYSLYNFPEYKIYSYIALGLITIGGLILGPIVQKYAFNEYWAGIPWGWDLTDNKTLFGFLAWLIAVLLNLKKERKWAIVAGAIFIMFIFTIPHSMHGSQRDPETGKIISA
jgi:hypothetical protein